MTFRQVLKASNSPYLMIIGAIGLLLLVVTCVHGQSLEFQVPGVSISSAEQLLIEQIEDLNAAGEIDEAIRTLEQLFEACDGRIVESAAPQSARTLVTQNYIPVRQWIQSRLARLLIANPAARTTYVTDHRAAANAALAESVANRDLVRTRQLADRYSQTAAGVELRLLLADLYLERVWGVAAIQAVRQLLPSQSLINVAPAHIAARGTGKADGPVAADVLPREKLNWSERLSKEAWQFGDPQKQATEAFNRVIDAAAICENCANREQTFARLAVLAEALPTSKQTLLERLTNRNTWQVARPRMDQWSTFGGSSARHGVGEVRLDPSGWPTWNQTLERYNSSSDRTSASKPRVGELESGALLYHPAIYDGRVFVNELNRISAFDLKSGKPWPEIEPPLPLFDSQISPASLLPLGYPMVGMPRGTVAIYDNCLYARLGSPVTAWASGQAAPDGGSLSYVVGLDLQRQGSLLRGFPLRLSQFDFAGAEPEGCPLIIGDSLFVAVVKRDNVGLRRSVAAFDRFSGELIWKSAVLASGVVEGSDRANLLSSQLLSAAGGRLFYNTNLGSIVCLDPLTGQIEWLTRYRRAGKEMQAYPQPDRYRYRDLNPCLIHSGLVLCAPQDCPEVFALDAITGELVWSTDSEAAADAIHVLGVSKSQFMLSGDRLIWLNLATGHIDGRFPAAGTSGNINALPSPRGLGRGIISNNEIYWPTANEIIVFSTSLEPGGKIDAPPMIRRIRLDTRGAEGGNLVTSQGWLLIATPSRLLAFDGPPEPKKVKPTSAPIELK